jgi:hypothetical protein
LREEIPEEVAALVAKMMAKNPWDRYQTPAELINALIPLTRTPIPPPPPAEMPILSLAVRRFATPGKVSDSVVLPAPGGNSWVRPVAPGSKAVAAPVIDDGDGVAGEAILDTRSKLDDESRSSD